MLASDRKDHRPLPLSARKAKLARLLSRQVDGIFIAEFQQGDIGQILFRVACNMALEGIVSKCIDRAYGAGKCNHWEKLKNLVLSCSRAVRDLLASKGCDMWRSMGVLDSAESARIPRRPPP